jgi:DNA-binding GntR family transcriptional regulator
MSKNPIPSTIERQSSVSLTLLAHEKLRSDILNGHYRPGQKLLIHQLRDRYQFGASPLREALSRLATESLVVHNDNRGFVVAEANAEGLRDLVSTRIAIEGLALQKALLNRTSDWEEGIVLSFHHLSRTERSTNSDNYEENPQWEALHRAFHLSLLKACGSQLLLSFCEQMYDQAYRYRQLAARKAYRVRNELGEHKAIFEAVIENRVDEAHELMAAHYQQTAQRFIE